jgi:hypothetical protein
LQELQRAAQHNGIIGGFERVSAAKRSSVQAAHRSHRRLGTTMLRLSERRRELLADKLPDAANVALGALVFGQFLGEGPYSIAIPVVGMALWLVLMTAALLCSGERHG